MRTVVVLGGYVDGVLARQVRAETLSGGVCVAREHVIAWCTSVMPIALTDTGGAMRITPGSR